MSRLLFEVVFLFMTLLLPAKINVRDDRAPYGALEAKLISISDVGNQGAIKFCQSSLEIIDGKSSVLSPKQKALGLDRLREACKKRLAWTEPLMLKIALRSVERLRLQYDQPAALCRSLRDIGLAYHYLSMHKEARSSYQEAVVVALRYLGKGTSVEDVAAGYESMSSLLLDMGEGNLLAAKDAARKSVELRQRAVVSVPQEEQKKNLMLALSALARVEELTNLKSSKQVLMKAFLISKELSSRYNSEKSKVIANLGEILYRLGDLRHAIDLLRQCEAMRLEELRLGRPVRALAATQLVLGHAFHDLGDYPRAIEYLRKAVDGHAQWLGRDPYRFCDALTALASVQEESGQWDLAIASQAEALNIRRDAVLASKARKSGRSALQLAYARSLTSVAVLQHRMGKDRAIGLLKIAFEIENRFLKNQPSSDRATTLLAMADYYRTVGELVLARRYVGMSVKELIGVQEAGPLLFEAKVMSASVAVDPVEGLREIEEARILGKRLYGGRSPNIATVLQVRSELRERQGDKLGALSDALASYKLSLPHVKSVVEAFPRDQALAFAANRRRSLDIVLDIAADIRPLNSALLSDIWQIAASSRMLVFDAESNRQRLLRVAASSPALRELAGKLIAARERFAFVLVQSQGRPENRATRILDARRELSDAEEAFARKAVQRLESEKELISTRVLRRRLPKDSVLVSIYQYRRLSGAQAYVGFVLRADGPSCVRPLGDAAVMDSLVFRWRHALLTRSGDPRGYRKIGVQLRRRVWDQLEPCLGSSRNVLAILDGALHLVPLAALPVDEGRYLIERGWSFHYLSAERDLLEPLSEGVEPLGPILAVGGVNYNNAGVAAGTVSRGGNPVCEKEGRCSGRGVSRIPGCRDGLPYFPSLPRSLLEVRDLRRLGSLRRRLSLAELTGSSATEQVLRASVDGKRVLHFATHGFSLASRCVNSKYAVRGIGSLKLNNSKSTNLGYLSFSGLALAGANKRQQASNSDQDGILTEQEILSLKLEKADWVVLAACNSGVGSVQRSEGVMGLLRSFQLAGARTVIVSLWPVTDDVARSWMRDLYQGRFEYGLTTADAVREASRRSLSRCRKVGDDNPVKWAGFIANGDWR
jgi:CHAT domain-containing protein